MREHAVFGQDADSVVMNWLFGAGQPTAPSTQPTEVPDSPTALAAELFRVNRFINASAGQLPDRGVVAARRITDTVGTVLHSHPGSRPGHPRQGVAERDPARLPADHPADLPGAGPGHPRPAAGRRPDPTAALGEQLEFLLGSATEVLTAVRNDDANALVAQGSFLRTKFARSELDL